MAWIFSRAVELNTTNVKLTGESALATGFGLDQSASSIEFTLTGSSKIELNGSWSNHSNDVYFTVYINGARQDKRVRFTYLDRSAVIADGLNYKNTYTIKLVRETEEKYGQFIARSLNIGYLGRMLDAPAQKNLHIEFIGDSITCGLGSLCGYLSDDGLNVSDTDGGTCGIESTETSLCEDATNSYAYLAAQTLNADCKFISYSGKTVANMSTYYADYYDKKRDPLKPDLVVINFGDYGTSTGETFKTEVKALIDMVKSTHGNDVKIIWATGVDDAERNAYIQNAINSYSNVFYCATSINGTGGHNGHPTKEGAKVAAKELVDYILNEKILTDKENALAMPTDSQGNSILSSDYSLTWYDGFSSSSLDLSQWNQTLGTSTRTQQVVDGLGDNLYFNQKDGCSDMVMSSRMIESEKLYTRPRDVSTENRMAYKYGYLEIRAKVPHGRPAYPAFWMKSNLTIDKANAAPYMTEVDIFEIMASDTISPNIHKWTSGIEDSQQAVSGGGPMSGAARKTLKDDDYHTYGFMITKEGVGFYFDGERYLEVSAGETWWFADQGDTTNRKKGFNDYFFIILRQHIFTEDSVWKAYKGCEVQPGDKFPINFAIDYIRLYQDDQGKIFYGQLPK